MINFRKTLALVTALSLAVSATVPSFADTTSTTPDNRPVFRIYTYNEIANWGAAKAITPAFEKICNCKVEWESAKHQSIMLKSYLINFKKAQYDAILGLNIGDATLAKTRYSRYFTPVVYDINALTNLPSSKNWNNPFALPVSSSAVTVEFNTDQVKLNPVKYNSWVDWINGNDNSFIFGDPSAGNDLGKALNAVIAYYYPTYKEQLAAWKKVKAHTVTIGASWSTSYGVFAKGESQTGLSYSSSVIYYALVEKKPNFQNLIFKAGSPFLVDSYLIPANSKQPKIAQQFAKYILSPFAQRALFINNSSYPVITVDNSDLFSAEEKALADQIKDYPLLDVRSLPAARLESSLKAFKEVFTK